MKNMDSTPSPPSAASFSFAPLVTFLLVLVVLAQFVQVWQAHTLPLRMIAAQAEAAQAAKLAADRVVLAKLQDEMRYEEAQRQRTAEAFEQREFEQALVRIPADIPEPKRSEAARALMKIELEGPKEGETQSQYETRMAVRRAQMMAGGL